MEEFSEYRLSASRRSTSMYVNIWIHFSSSSLLGLYLTAFSGRAENKKKFDSMGVVIIGLKWSRIIFRSLVCRTALLCRSLELITDGTGKLSTILRSIS